MTRQFLIGTLLSLIIPAALAADGLLTVPSTYTVTETVDRLAVALEAKGFRIFARVDHGAGAKSVNMDLAPTELLIFGKPQGGTRLMQAERSTGIDLPLKFLVWEDADGTVTIGWNDPVWMAKRHGIDAQGPVIKTISKALENFAKQAGH
ncbi:DUF302 domain-containing protein [Congregibacter sp.]|uniref:DUF302 domain-containing protein n=1 Tax=Congregibacter sp. TaxID=2744308 RepID=UPI003F6B2DC6